MNVRSAFGSRKIPSMNPKQGFCCVLEPDNAYGEVFGIFWSHGRIWWWIGDAIKKIWKLKEGCTGWNQWSWSSHDVRYSRSDDNTFNIGKCEFWWLEQVATVEVNGIADIKPPGWSHRHCSPSANRGNIKELGESWGNNNITARIWLVANNPNRLWQQKQLYAAVSVFCCRG